MRPRYGRTLADFCPSRRAHPEPWCLLLPLCVRRCSLLFAGWLWIAGTICDRPPTHLGRTRIFRHLPKGRESPPEPSRGSPSNNIESLLCKVPCKPWKIIHGTSLLRIVLWNVRISVRFNLRNACKPFGHLRSPSHTSRPASASSGHSSSPYFLRAKNRSSSWILRSRSVASAALSMRGWVWVLEIRIHLLRSCTSRFSNFYHEFH